MVSTKSVLGMLSSSHRGEEEEGGEEDEGGYGGIVQLAKLRQRKKVALKKRVGQLWRKVRLALLAVGNMTNVQEVMLWNANVKDVIDALHKPPHVRERSDILALAKVLSTIKALSHLSQKMLEEVAEVVECEAFPTDRIIFRKGDEGSKFYVILSGRVAVLSYNDEGEETILVRLHTGDAFGELALINGEPRTASCKTMDNALLLTLDREDYLKKVQASQEEETKKKIEDLRRCALFNTGIQRDVLFRILATFSTVRYEKGGAILYKQGQEVDSAYVIRKGYVRLLRSVTYSRPSRGRGREEGGGESLLSTTRRSTASSYQRGSTARSGPSRGGGGGGSVRGKDKSGGGGGEKSGEEEGEAPMREEREGSTASGARAVIKPHTYRRHDGLPTSEVVRDAIEEERASTLSPILPISAVRELRMATVGATEKRLEVWKREMKKREKRKARREENERRVKNEEASMKIAQVEKEKRLEKERESRRDRDGTGMLITIDSDEEGEGGKEEQIGGREWKVKPGESATHHLQLRLDQTQHGVRMNARGAATVRALVEPGRRLDEIFRKNMEKSPHSARLYNEVQKAVEKKNKEALEMFEDNHALYFPILVSRGLTMSANAFDREVRSIVSRGSDMKSGGGVGSAGKSGSSVGGGGDLQSRGGRMRGGGRMNGAKSMPALSKKKVALPHLQTEQACLTCIPSSSNLSPRFSSAIASTPTPSSLLSHRSRMQVENQLHKLETAESVFEVDRVGPGSVIGVGEVFTKAPGRCTSAVADGRVEVVRITKWDLLRNFTREESNFLLGLIGAWEHSLLTGDIDEELLDLAASRWEWGEIRKNVLQQAVEDKKIEKAAKTPLPKLR